MRINRLLSPMLGSTTLLLLLLFLIAGCGTNPSSTGAAATAKTTATPCPSNQFQTAIGTIQSISGSTLLITSMQGKSIKATYSSSTRFLQQSSPVVSSLKEGTAVTVVITQNADNTYTATRIMVTDGSARTFRQGTNSSVNCLNRSQFSTSGSRRSGTTTNARGITGTIGQVNGNLLTVTDTQGSDYTMTVTSKTQIMQSSNATAADLKTGQAISVSGSPDGHGGINARTVTILQKLPTRPTQ